MKILLFGKDGQVGWELQRSLAPLGELVALGPAGGPGLCGDFADAEGLARTVAEVRPDLVVNAAAYTAVDQAEREPEVARQVNALAPAALARAAQRVGAALVHYSTDYVFDGSGSRPWVESDGTGPLNIYGQTKLEGEQAVRETAECHLILRTSWVYAARGGNFARTMLRLAGERERLTVIDDQVGAPTGAELLADATAHAVRGWLADPRKSGTYHVAAAGETTWHAYARFVVAHAASCGVELKVVADRIEPVASTAYPTPARRPLNSRLATQLFRDTFALALPPWEQGVARMLDELLTQP